MKIIASVLVAAALTAFILVAYLYEGNLWVFDGTVFPSNTASDTLTVSPDERSRREYEEIKQVYPKTWTDHERFVIDLPKKADEGKYQVQLIVGQTRTVDVCNSYGLEGGSFTEETVQGYGYTFYVFDSSGEMWGTLLGCSGQQEKFIVSSAPMISYNSKSPIVVFVPKGYELKYSIWSEGNEIHAKKG